VTLIGRPKSFVTEPTVAKAKTTNGNHQRNQSNNAIAHTNNAMLIVPPPSKILQPLRNQSENVCNNVTSQSNSLQNCIPPVVVESNNNSPPVSLQQQTLKQRFNTIVMRTLADNTERDRSLQTAQMGDAWKLKVLQQTRVIATPRESLQVIEDIINPRKPPPDGKIVVSFDCEGINLGVKGQLTLVQIGTMSGQAYVFDLFTCPSLVQTGGLQKLLEHPQVIKVIK